MRHAFLPLTFLAFLLPALARAEAPPVGQGDGGDAPHEVKTSNTTALRINGKLIGLKKVEAVFQEALPLVQERLRSGDLDAAEKAKALQKAWDEALQTVIQDTLLDERGRELRTQIMRAYVQHARPDTPPSRVVDSFKRLEAEEVRKMKQWKIEAAGGEEELYAALRRRGLSVAEWEDNLRAELFRRIVLEQAVGPIVFSPEKVKGYYDAHPDQFSTPDAWRLRRIRLPKKRFKTPEDAMAAAVVIHKRIADGLAFEKVAKTLDHDPPYNADGGQLSVDGKVDLPSGNFPAEERIAKDLEDGAVSKPVDAGEAVLIVKREAYRPEKKLAFEESANRAWYLMLATEVKARKEAFFNKEMKDAFVETVQKTPPEKYLK
ncbi:MAG: peptidyl-prolyl cis-trans isomerase [Planctomycetes bacterium]|nr:peptidyl-prolyl cis-trans isomerase [Planctomycetota bacterium]